MLLFFLCNIYSSISFASDGKIIVHGDGVYTKDSLKILKGLFSEIYVFFNCATINAKQ